jgi:acetyltransferase
MAKPYPSELVRTLTLRDGTRVVVRPIRPEDRQIEREFVQQLSNESKYFRFMSGLRELSEAMLNRFTQIDYDREMALIAIVCEKEKETEIGVARYIVNADNASCEFAVAVADAWQNRGVGTALIRSLTAAARARGLLSMEGIVVARNSSMLGLMHALGFSIQAEPGDASIRHVTKQLDLPSSAKVRASNAAASDVN